MASLKRFIAGAHTKGGVSLTTDGPSSVFAVSFGGPTSLSVAFTTAGDIEGSGSSGSSDLGDWYTPNETGVGSGYWVRCTYQSGSAIYSSGAGLNSWLQLSSNRTWSFLNSAPGYSSLTGTYRWEIASDSGGSTILGTKDCAITLDVETI
jgi:hypothetical protein